MKAPYARLRQIDVLDGAWAHVRANAQRSICSETRGEAQAFANDERRNLNRIQRQLQRGTFTFEPQRGVLIKKRGKGKRPIVIAPVESRIVQRALLEIIQAHPAIRSRLTQGFNFGGIVGRGFGVPAAVKKAWITSRTHPFYIRTDIRSFFTAVPRATALAKIEAVIDDAQFNALLKSATDVELINVETMGSDVSLFPLFEEGVAQGSCLSPLLCNLLLSDFDEQMNDRGIVCIRYIDDFIIFAKNRAAALKAFEAGALSLQRLGLGIYDPRLPDGAAKSAQGHVAAGFSFLGCEVYPDRVRPSKRNRDDLKAAVEEIFETALGAIRDPERAVRKRLTYSDALRTASLTVRGWGNTHAFCSDDALMRDLDRDLDRLFDRFNQRVGASVRRMSERDRRRALGFFLLEDCIRCEEPDSLRAMISAARKPTAGSASRLAAVLQPNR